MSNRLAAFVLLALAPLAHAQDFTPEVKGDGVKVVTSVAKLPFSVVAPSTPGGYYAWFVGDGVKYVRKTSNSIEVTAAPKGEVTITVDAVSFDKMAQQLVVRTGAVTVLVGEMPRPPPVPPDPGPTPPIPTGKVARIVVVEDTAKAGQWRGDLLGSPAISAFYKSSGLKHRLISTNAKGDAEDVAVYLNASKGKTLPRIWTYDASGNELFAGDCPLTEAAFLEVIGAGSQPRSMGNNPSPIRFAWRNFGDTPNVPLIPRSQWKAVDLSAYLPPVHDQDGRGQCVASAVCAALESCRSQAGLGYTYLSAGDLYSRINGGRDQGALLEDGLAESIENGVCKVASVPYVWDGRNHNDAATVAERRRYMTVEAYLCPSFDAMASAVQQGFFIIEGLMWYDNFVPDREGWLPSAGRGGAGGHALCGYGLVQRNGVWGIRTRNSWSGSWGVGGNCVIGESLFGQSVGGFWAVRSVTQTAQRITPPSRRHAGLELVLAP